MAALILNERSVHFILIVSVYQNTSGFIWNQSWHIQADEAQLMNMTITTTFWQFRDCYYGDDSSLHGLSNAGSVGNYLLWKPIVNDLLITNLSS